MLFNQKTTGTTRTIVGNAAGVTTQSETTGGSTGTAVGTKKWTFKVPWAKLLLKGQSLWFILALLVVREAFPEVAIQIAPVYEFLDSIVLPIINWLYAIAMKLLNWLMSWPFMGDILEWLNSLAM